MAEERRLFYVGITRAKRRLYLVHCFRRSLWGDSNVQAPSRFLDEIPDESAYRHGGQTQPARSRVQTHDGWDGNDGEP